MEKRRAALWLETEQPDELRLLHEYQKVASFRRLQGCGKAPSKINTRLWKRGIVETRDMMEMKGERASLEFLDELRECYSETARWIDESDDDEPTTEAGRAIKERVRHFNAMNDLKKKLAREKAFATTSEETERAGKKQRIVEEIDTADMRRSLDLGDDEGWKGALAEEIAAMRGVEEHAAFVEQLDECFGDTLRWVDSKL